MSATVTSRVSATGVSTLARWLMAIEKARVLCRKPVGAKALALESEARHSAKARGKQAIRGAQYG